MTRLLILNERTKKTARKTARKAGTRIRNDDMMRSVESVSDLMTMQPRALASAETSGMAKMCISRPSMSETPIQGVRRL